MGRACLSIACCAALLRQSFARLACQGIHGMSSAQWEHIKNFKNLWMDLDLGESRVMLRVLFHVMDSGLEDHIEDCAFGTLTLMLSSLRAADYDLPHSEAVGLYHRADSLRQQLVHIGVEMEAAAEEAGWSMQATLPDLEVYPWLLSMEAEHNCGGTNLRFYVYDLPDPYSTGILHCQHGQWGTEVLIPHYFRTGSCLTKDPLDADFFIVAWHTWCERMVHNRSADSGKLPARYQELMDSDLLPYFHRNDGMDHIFIFGDQGLNYFPQWRDSIHRSVFLLTEALTPDCGPGCYQPWKDIIIPGHVDYFRWRRMQEYNRRSEERNLLLNFHGRHPGTPEQLGGALYRNNSVRGAIMEAFEEKADCSVGGFVDDYFEIMGSSHFCLVPMGTSSWTNHLYESFFAGCIPVILSDDFEVPFQRLLPWTEMSIKWPMDKVKDGLYEFLSGVSADALSQMKAKVDEYGSGFVNELDYVREAQSALSFEESVQRLGLGGVVLIATPFQELTTGRILVTRWVDGDRIDALSLRNREGARLCSVALTAYLAMLLEMGQLHADPHPGNLLRAPDGRLVILDWGLVTSVPDDTQVAIVSYIAHLLAEDYDAIPQDLVDLGFIRKDKQYLLEEESVVRAISSIFRGLASGGGAQKRVRDIMPEIRELRRDNTGVLELPTYFAYILRAFSLLEGVGLEQDPNYKIVSDCYPYLISWLLREERNQTQQILEALLYEPRQRLKMSASSRPPLSARRLKRLFEAFEAYMARSTPVSTGDDASGAAAESQETSSGSGDGNQSGNDNEQQEKKHRRKGQFLELLRRLLRSEAFRDLAIKEVVRTTDVLAREAHEVAAALPLGSCLGPVAPKTEEDEAVLNSLETIATGLLDRVSSSRAQRVVGGIGEVLLDEQVIQAVLTELSESSSEGSFILRQLVGEFADRIAARLDSVDVAGTSAPASGSSSPL